MSIKYHFFHSQEFRLKILICRPHENKTVQLLLVLCSNKLHQKQSMCSHNRRHSTPIQRIHSHRLVGLTNHELSAEDWGWGHQGVGKGHHQKFKNYSLKNVHSDAHFLTS